MIYLAQPYSHKDPVIREERYEAALTWCAKLVDYFPYAPIVHWHNVAIRHALPTEAAFWLKLNFHMIEKARNVHVLLLDGWKESNGLYEELRYCEASGKAIFTIDPSSENIHLVTTNILLREMTGGDNHKERVLNFGSTQANEQGRG